MLKAKGFILLDDGRKLPFMGTANNQSLEEWNAEAARQAAELYKEDHGKDPESIEQALEYQRQKYADLDRTQPTASQDIPVIHDKAKIVYYQ